MNKLVIVPINTTIELNLIEQVCKDISHKFGQKYEDLVISDNCNFNLKEDKKFFSDAWIHRVPGFFVTETTYRKTVFDYFKDVFPPDNVLAITDMPLIEQYSFLQNEYGLMGICDLQVRRSIISRYIIGTEVNETSLKNFLTSIALHEIGHMHGLNHHKKNLNESYCLMNPLHKIKKLKPEIGKLEGVLLRGMKFCLECENLLLDST